MPSWCRGLFTLGELFHTRVYRPRHSACCTIIGETMSKAASIDALNRIHRKLTKAIDEELDNIIGSEHGIGSSMVNAISAFLKANEITADVESEDNLKSLREKLAAARGSNLVQDASETEYLN